MTAALSDDGFNRFHFLRSVDENGVGLPEPCDAIELCRSHWLCWPYRRAKYPFVVAVSQHVVPGTRPEVQEAGGGWRLRFDQTVPFGRIQETDFIRFSEFQP